MIGYTRLFVFSNLPREKDIFSRNRRSIPPKKFIFESKPGSNTPFSSSPSVFIVYGEYFGATIFKF